MSIKGTPSRPEPQREFWIGIDPAEERADMTAVTWLWLDPRIQETEEELAAEARRTGILISIALPTGFLVAWVIDWITGGPGLASMLGL